MAENSNRKIKTVIIDDSSLMRIMMADALRADPAIEVLDTASNGKEGVDIIKKLDPDVVVTDIIMPEYDGLYVVREVMKNNPRPILLLSSLTRTNAEVFDALEAGAVDFIDKPVDNGSNGFERSMDQLIEKIKLASSINTQTIKSINGELDTEQNEPVKSAYDVIAIGASTGGPSAVEAIIGKLPQNFKQPVIIAQHMPERFIESFGERLSETISLEVRVPEDEEIIRPGVVYLAPGTTNLKVEKVDEVVRFKYSEDKFEEFNCPSIDCLFGSLTEVYESKMMAIILTGMGKDGASGMKKVKAVGGMTIAQDAASCVVNGMPGAATELGAVQKTVNLNEIPGYIISCL